MWYASAMNYDMMSPNPWNTMNLHMNQLWDHSAAWNNMFAVPQYSFDNFMPYGNMYGNSYLTNPMYTLNQMSWGTPAWNNMPWNNGGNMGNMWGNMGWNGGMFGPSNSSSTGNSSNSTANRKYNRLLTFIKQLVKYEDGLSASDIDKLNDAMRNAKGTTEEKYETLLDAYNEIDKDTIRDFLVEGGHKLGVSSDVKNSDKNKDTFYNRLIGTGFEYETDMDNQVETFYDEIKTLSGSDGTSKKAEGIIKLINNRTYDILDFVSSWNNNYKDDSEASRVIDHIAKYYNEIDDKDQKSDAKKLILKPFVEELIDKANSVKKSLDADSKEAIEDTVSKIRDSLNNTEDSVDSSLTDLFDKLYLYTRQGAMAELRNDAKAYYGEIDDEVFNDKLFQDDMIKDLESEGFTTDEINDTAVAISEKKAKRASRSKDDEDDDDTSKDALKDIDKKSSTVQVAVLKSEGILTELTNVKYGDKTLYQEKSKTVDTDNDGKADYARLFYINDDGKLVEWQGAKLDENNKLVAGIGETTVKASEINKASKKAEKVEKETAKLEAEHANAKSNGSYIASTLSGATEDFAYKKVNEKISSKYLNKTNIIEFVGGYYNNTDNVWFGHKEGLIEFLDDEHDDGQISMANKKNIIKSFLDNEEVQKFKNEPEYEQLKHLLEKYDGSEAKDFNHGGFNRTINGIHKPSSIATYGGAGLAVAGAGLAWATAASNFWNPVGWGAAIVGVAATAYSLLDGKTDNEVIDDCMKALYDKVIAARQGA